MASINPPSPSPLPPRASPHLSTVRINFQSLPNADHFPRRKKLIMPVFSHNDKFISWLNGDHHLVIQPSSTTTTNLSVWLNGDRHLIFQPQWQTVGRNAGHLTTTCCMHQTEQDSQSPWDSGNGVSSVSLVLKLRKCPVPNISQQMCQHCGRCQLGQGFF